MTSQYGRGLSYLRQQREAHPQRSESTMLSFWPSPNEITQFWFLNEPDEFLIPLIHSVERTRRSPKPGQKATYSADVLCGRHSYDEPKEQCEYCVADAKGPWQRAAAYIFVEKVFHKNPPPEGKGVDWKPLRRAGTDQTIWEETVNAPRFFMMKDAMAEQVEAEYLGDPDNQTRTPTLLDRPFRVDVTGEGATRRDVLKHQDPRPMPADAVEARTSLPPLEETAVAKMGERKITPRTNITPDDLPFHDGDPGPTEPVVDENDLISFD